LAKKQIQEEKLEEAKRKRAEKAEYLRFQYEAEK